MVAAGTQSENSTAQADNQCVPNTRLGAVPADNGVCEFTVWAPNFQNVDVRFLGNERAGDERMIRLSPGKRGYHTATISDVEPNTRYLYKLDGKSERADPASRFQAEGVFGPSQVVDLSSFPWTDPEWRGLALKDYILYELHVGTFTPAGTLDAITDHLADLKSLGITAIELMPLAQFSGDRNWGYDGVFPFAVQNNYGGPFALQRLVNACHAVDLAVVLDVVYNHLGPEGNVLLDFGPYFTNRYRTPWGDAVNFDGPQSDEVVRYFVENAIGWLEDFHIDALRLDAIHGIFDRSAQPFLALLSAATDELASRTNRRIHLIAESDLNDSHFVSSRDGGGYGLHAQWNDDFHHSLHSLQTGERVGYYQDFGSLRDMEQAFRQGYVYTGQYSEYRRHRHGNSPRTIHRSQFVVCSQNHDQVGNRMLGERSSALLSFEAQKLSAGCVLLSPYVPLLFMGEEYGEVAPFLYFTSHQDPALAKAVREGRTREFAAFHAQGSPPDPQSEDTFLRSKLDRDLRRDGSHRVLFEFYRELIRLRKSLPALYEPDASILEVTAVEGRNCLQVVRKYKQDEVFMMFNFGTEALHGRISCPSRDWRLVLDSAESKWMGPREATDGSEGQPIHPKSFRLYQHS